MVLSIYQSILLLRIYCSTVYPKLYNRLVIKLEFYYDYSIALNLLYNCIPSNSILYCMYWQFMDYYKFLPCNKNYCLGVLLPWGILNKYCTV